MIDQFAQDRRHEYTKSPSDFLVARLLCYKTVEINLHRCHILCIYENKRKLIKEPDVSLSLFELSYQHLIIRV